MRLIEVSSLLDPMAVPNINIVEIFDSSDEKYAYAILSHRWGDDEVTYQDLTSRDPMVKQRTYRKQGYFKLFRMAETARDYSVKWVWCDTCCIDKTNTAELSEAINSMFKWYKDSKYCFAYLADWGIKVPQLTQSEWFERCWTLQELIAPRKVIFFDGHWNERGNKLDLAQEISRRTRIDSLILVGQQPFDRFSIAQRMSWSAGRKAAKVEDKAYCLLGIFDVSMPMLYGEGERAFVRLQEEIIQRNADQSIFVWASKIRSNNLLASSASDFKECDEVRQTPLHKRPFALNNLGLEIELELRQIGGNTYAGYLACENMTPDHAVSLVLELEPGTTYLRRIRSCLSQEPERYSRAIRKQRRVTILRKVPDKYLRIPVPLYGFQLGGACQSLVLVNDFDYRKYWDAGRWRTDDRPVHPSAYPIFSIPDDESTSIASMVLFIGRNRFLIHLMYDFDFRPCCYISKQTHTSGPFFYIRSSGDAESEQRMAWLEQESGWTPNGNYLELDEQMHPYTEESVWAVKSLHRGGFTARIPRDFTRPYRDIDISFTPHPVTSDWIFDLRHEQAIGESPFWDLGFPIVSGNDDLENILMRHNLPGLDPLSPT